MKWNCKTISLNTLAVTPNGPIKETKCDTCKTSDCSYRIEKVNVSIVGVTKKMRCLIVGNYPSMVIDCDGYAPNSR
jgi:hypothetical protein